MGNRIPVSGPLDGEKRKLMAHAATLLGTKQNGEPISTSGSVNLVYRTRPLRKGASEEGHFPWTITQEGRRPKKRAGKAWILAGLVLVQRAREPV